MKDAQYWIDKLELTPHVEGGFFKETHRSAETIGKIALPDRFGDARSFYTAIYFLLRSHDFSAFHRIKQDEMWHFYHGDPLTVHIIGRQGNYSQITLGRNLENGEVFQAMVPHGSWFGANLQAPASFALVGCTVAPGFDFSDLEIAKRDVLLDRYPEHQQIIDQLTRY